ncbi:MAG: PhoX family phosphatase [Reyranella sp.]|uniref:PhoX family protein n=1 Tax=Reyranella sp. TaxID=1929291 RepID=UPI002731CC9B|nr:PhoX family phosphatase [Reyranella sp.]MDP1961364.1 PhoX family phosphatase [Reyranella sp.]MDP2375444.1 PhoX family phosphatase [Reyranella sp.]
MHDDNDVVSNNSAETSIGELIERRLSRRGALAGLAGTAVFAALGGRASAQAASSSSFTFKEVPHVNDPTHHVPDDYEVQVLIRWGDPVLPGAPAYDPMKQSAATQALQFGYNNDFLGLHALPAGSVSGDRFLMVVNHEYTNTNLMLAGIGEGREARLRVDQAGAEIEMAAHGGSVIEITREGRRWKVVDGSRYARRIDANTPMRIAGPAAGDGKMKTSADPAGTKVLGMFNNCAGGATPWGTWLTCEENVNFYFTGDQAKHADQALAKRYGIGQRVAYAWGRYFDRFNFDKEPNEPNRFGWIVEIDPYEPQSTPVKRTALGRFAHEGCHHAVAKDGRVVCYMGDDSRFEYVYKFVTAKPWSPTDRAANRDLLNEGTLYVARFDEGGKVVWLPLLHGQGPLTAENGFASQADVVIGARRAGDLLKATPMDRPEDVEPNKVNGRVYVALSNNGSRKPEQVNPANPRAKNDHGHILEIAPKDGDHASTEGTWSIFVAGGQPGKDEGAKYHPETSADGWLTCPDNVAFDSKGRLWIATDSGEIAGIADGLYACDVAGPGRALTRQFFAAPKGSEVCGPIFTPDDRTLFLAIQHPGEGKGSTYETPATRWPDFKDGAPPRPSVLVITKKDGGIIGS